MTASLPPQRLTNNNGRHRRGLMFVISSPSGVGKTTLSRRLLAENDELVLSISVTTRPPRQSEADGRDYFFIDETRFCELRDAGQLLEHAEVFGNHYGTPRNLVEKTLARGRDVLFDIDWQGARQIEAKAADDLVRVFLLPPSMTELASRLRNRAGDPDAVIQLRMGRAADEIQHWAEYDYVLVNDDLEATYANLRAILLAERQRRKRQPWLHDHVDRLIHQPKD